MYAIEAIETLRQNDPAITGISILLDGETPEADLAQALEQNPFVTNIVLDLGGVQRTDWDSLLWAIAMRANLVKVELHDIVTVYMGPARTHTAPVALVRSFLHAMQNTSAIQSVELACRLPTDISMFVNAASSITSFCLVKCDMEPAERDQGARELAAALHRKTNIERLELFQLEDIYAIPILEGLGSNVSLTTFIFSPCVPLSDAAPRAIQHLLESTTSIQRFELQQVDFWRGRRGSVGRLFRPIAQGIINSECVSELKLDECQFSDRESFAQLQDILQNKRNLTNLCFRLCDFFRGGQVAEAIASALLRPDSSLRCFEFDEGYMLGNVFARIQFENLLQAIQKSKLERFQIGYITTPHYLQALTESIPSMKLKELELDFWDNDNSDNEDEAEGEFDEETIMRDLLHAVKNNFSLRSVKAELFGRDPDNDDKQTLAFYANRNELLDQWVGNPETVEQKVWPEALHLSQRAGPNALFRGLRAALESDYGSLPGRRKRKRPQY